MDTGKIVRDKRLGEIILSNLAGKDEPLLGNFREVISPVCASVSVLICGMKIIKVLHRLLLGLTIIVRFFFKKNKKLLGLKVLRTLLSICIILSVLHLTSCERQIIKLKCHSNAFH